MPSSDTSECTCISMIIHPPPQRAMLYRDVYINTAAASTFSTRSTRTQRQASGISSELWIGMLLQRAYGVGIVPCLPRHTDPRAQYLIPCHRRQTHGHQPVHERLRGVDVHAHVVFSQTRE